MNSELWPLNFTVSKNLLGLRASPVTLYGILCKVEFDWLLKGCSKGTRGETDTKTIAKTKIKERVWAKRILDG